MMVARSVCVNGICNMYAFLFIVLPLRRDFGRVHRSSSRSACLCLCITYIVYIVCTTVCVCVESM